MPASLSGVTVTSDGGLLGAAELSRRLVALGQQPITRADIRGAIEPAYQKAVQTIPVGSEAHRTYKGRLVAPGFSQRSLRVVSRVDKNGTIVSAALGVRKEAYYAVLFTELGTSKIPARPWLRPALRTTQDNQQRVLGASIKRRLERIAGGQAKK